jgi:mono/diheme cytochrome c family protein
MLIFSSSSRTAILALALTASLFLFAGCNNTPTSTPPPGAAGTSGMPPRGDKMAASGGGSGQELLAANCRCHNGGKAPDLSHEGSDPTHTAGWIAEYAANPKSKNPSSKMPPMEGKISSDDLKKIAEYVASQK